MNILTLVDRHDIIPPPTAVALSPSGDRLAVLGHTSVWLFPRPERKRGSSPGLRPERKRESSSGLRPEDDTRWFSTESHLPCRRRVDAGRDGAGGDVQALRIVNEQRDVLVPTVEKPLGR